jgi:hypothetical protein
VGRAQPLGPLIGTGWQKHLLLDQRTANTPAASGGPAAAATRAVSAVMQPWACGCRWRHQPVHADNPASGKYNQVAITALEVTCSHNKPACECTRSRCCHCTKSGWPWWLVCLPGVWRSSGATHRTACCAAGGPLFPGRPSAKAERHRRRAGGCRRAAVRQAAVVDAWGAPVRPHRKAFRPRT